MKTLIIYDSVFGNTEKIAQAIGSALDSAILQVNKASVEQLRGLDLLLIGSPTRGFRPTPAITDFLKSIPDGSLKGSRVAAFDTRLEGGKKAPLVLRFVLKIGSYAAPSIAAQFKRMEGNLVVPPEGFFVIKSEGPLKEGELERAAAWARLVDNAGKLH